MASPSGASPRAVELELALEKEPHKFSFFEALRRLEAVHPERPRFGESNRATDDPVRLTQEPSLAFAPSTLHAFERSKGGRAPRLSSLFLGLFGPNGPLPLHLTEYARQRIRENDTTFAHFVDIFHHRILSLFYRAWARVQPVVQYDRPKDDRFLMYVGSLCGLGMESLQDRDEMPHHGKLHYAGLLGCKSKSADGLSLLLSGFFQVPADVEQFVGRWLELPTENRTRLGADPAVSTLGSTVILGSRTWECHQKFRVILGPMKLADYRRLLPGTKSIRRLVSLVRNYVGDELTWDVRLILDKDEVPRMKLGTEQRLGWTTWLTTGPKEEHADALLVNPYEEPSPDFEESVPQTAAVS